MFNDVSVRAKCRDKDENRSTWQLNHTVKSNMHKRGFMVTTNLKPLFFNVKVLVPVKPSPSVLLVEWMLWCGDMRLSMCDEVP